MQSIVNFVRLLIAFILKAISVYVQTEAGAREANEVVQAWDMLDGQDNIPDLFGSVFPGTGTSTPKNPSGAASSGTPVQSNASEKAGRVYNRSRPTV